MFKTWEHIHCSLCSPLSISNGRRLFLGQFLQLVPPGGRPEASEDVGADLPGSLPTLGGGEFVPG